LSVKKENLLAHLFVYDKQVLYQKTGYILEHFRDAWSLSNDFFAACEAKSGKSNRFLPIRLGKR